MALKGVTPEEVDGKITDALSPLRIEVSTKAEKTSVDKLDTEVRKKADVTELVKTNVELAKKVDKTAFVVLDERVSVIDGEVVEVKRLMTYKADKSDVNVLNDSLVALSGVVDQNKLPKDGVAEGSVLTFIGGAWVAVPPQGE